MIRRLLHFRHPVQRAVILLVLGTLASCGTPDPTLPPPPSIDLVSAVQRGQELVTGFGSCGFCHSMNGQTSSDLGGGRVLRDAYGELHGPNITIASSGIGAWSELDVRQALRANVRPDGSQIASNRHRGFEWLADADITAITTYLRSLPAVEREVEPRRVSFFDRNITGFFDTRLHVRGYIPGLSPKFRTEYGQYLVDHVARCGSCHTKPGDLLSSEEYLAGGQEISFDGEDKVAPNITASKSAGLGSWSEKAIRDYLRSGRTPSGREVDTRFCPVQFYAQAPVEQVESVVAYLRSVPAVD